MELSEDKYYFADRRKKTLSNRVRRFVNNYWLIPVFTLCLEFFAIVLPPADSPLKHLKDRNLSFFRGPIILYDLASKDFPYILIGHFKEIALTKKFTFDIDQISSEDIRAALQDRETVRKIYNRVIESRDYKNTELGGIATLVYDTDGPRLQLYEITSVNKLFSEGLHKIENASIDEFLFFIQKQESREILAKVGMDDHLTDNLISVLLSEKPNRDQKRNLVKGFIKTYDIHSEAKYILSPYDFKSMLGSGKMSGKYLGLFHFHNDYMEPPSEIDIANSYNDRQIVFTLSDRGLIIYDIIRGKEGVYTSNALLASS